MADDTPAIRYTWHNSFDVYQPLAVLRYAAAVAARFPDTTFEEVVSEESRGRAIATGFAEAEAAFRADPPPRRVHVEMRSARVTVTWSGWHNKDADAHYIGLTVIAGSRDDLEAVLDAQPDGFSSLESGWLSVETDFALTIDDFWDVSEKLLDMPEPPWQERGRVHVTIDMERESSHTNSFDRTADARAALGWKEPAALCVSMLHGYRDWAVCRRRGGQIVLTYGREETGALHGQMVDWIERAAEIVGGRPLEPACRPPGGDATERVTAIRGDRARGTLAAVRAWTERNDVLLRYAIGLLAIAVTIAVAVATH